VRTVVCDTGPILHLAEADALVLLKYAAPVLVPPMVEAETTAHLANWRSHRPPWIEVAPLTPRYAELSKAWFSAGLLDAGEAEAVSLARQVKASWLLSDDAAAALFAKSLGLEVHGSLGVVLWCVAQGFLSGRDGRAVLFRLKESSLWLSERVMKEALEALARLTSKE
jgi:predicted nucleic acid-binding protein